MQVQRESIGRYSVSGKWHFTNYFQEY